MEIPDGNKPKDSNTVEVKVQENEEDDFILTSMRSNNESYEMTFFKEIHQVS